MGSRKETRLKVRYQETDQMGVVYHTNYLVWFEMGRTEWIRQQGISYRELENKGLLLPVVDARVRYHSPAFYDDSIIVCTEIKECRASKITFYYEVHREEKRERLVSGETKHIWVDKNWKITRLNKVDPDLYHRIISKLNQSENP